MIDTHDFNKLSNGELAQLYAATRREYIKQRDGVEQSETRRTKTAGQSHAHIVNGAVCECPEGLTSHYPEPEKEYVHPTGGIAVMRDGEDIPLTEEGRKIRFYESMPESDVARLSPDDQAALQEWRTARAEEIGAAFKKACPKYYPDNDNVLALVDGLVSEYLSARVNDYDDVEYYITLLLQRGAWTVPALTDMFNKQYKAGRQKPRPGVAKPLSADDLHRLSAWASRCKSDQDYERVISKYLEFSGIELSLREAIADSVYSPIVEKAIFWCWEQSRADYSPTSERRAFLKKWLSGRFVSVTLLDHAWAACQRAEEKGELQPQEAQPARRLNEDDRKLAQAQALADAIAQESFRGF